MTIASTIRRMMTFTLGAFPARCVCFAHKSAPFSVCRRAASLFSFRSATTSERVYPRRFIAPRKLVISFCAISSRSSLSFIGSSVTNLPSVRWEYTTPFFSSSVRAFCMVLGFTPRLCRKFTDGKQSVPGGQHTRYYHLLQLFDYLNINRNIRRKAPVHLISPCITDIIQ